jgi:RimJ/RimL family protein N-acetyltransferase
MEIYSGEKMLLNCNEIIVRDFQRKDAVNLFQIVREKNVLQFMPDWAEIQNSPHEFSGPIEWLQNQKDSADFYQRKPYAIALSETDELIGMVAKGLKETLNEIEMSYFMKEKYQRKGYTQKALMALAKWCFSVSDIHYMIATINCNNEASCKFAEKCGFELFEKRIPMDNRLQNMENNGYFYYRLYRKNLEIKEQFLQQKKLMDK